MFNLLVNYSGWIPPKGSVPKERFLNQTSREILEKLRPNGVLDLDAIQSLKALLMPEIDSPDVEPFGRIARIQNVKDIGHEYVFDFYFDHTIPPIPFEHIKEMAKAFGTSGFGLNNSHWSVKDFDLFELLYRRSVPEQADGHVFEIRRLPVKQRQIALMMPFDPRFNIVRDSILQLATELSCTCLRADNVWNEDVLIQEIINLIIESKIVICDATGRNPNVFYEAGIAHALGKKVIIITQNADDIPFDLKHLRYVAYLGNKQGVLDLALQLKPKVEQLINL